MTDPQATYYDWSQPLEDFRRGLILLRDHIASHRLYEVSEKDVENMNLALGLIDVIMDEDASWDDATRVTWDNLWELIRREMSSWWCPA